MPKYIKKTEKKEDNKIIKREKQEIRKSTKNKKVHAQEFKISKISAVIILLFSILVSTYLIHNKTNKFDDFIPVSDELNIISCVTDYAPNHGFFKTIFRIYDEIEANVRYYAYEIYMRYAVYSLMNDNDNTKWGKWSNLVYLYLLFLMILLITVFGKKIYQIVIPIAFTIILLAVSDWTSASFHYIRYYPFIIMSSVLVMFVNSYLLVNSKLHFYIKSPLILIMSVLPVLFHNQGAFMLLFWSSVMFILLIIRIIKSKKQLDYIILATILLVGVYIFYKWALGNIMSGIDKLDLDGFVPSLTKLAALSFPQSWWSVIIGILLIASISISHRHLSKFDKALILSSSILFVISVLLGAAIMGDKYSDYNGANRYFTFSHSIQLVFLASVLTGLYKFLITKINFKFNKETLFVLLSLPFITDIYSFTEQKETSYNFSILPQIRKSKLAKYKSNLKYIDYAVISGHTQSASSAFPEKKVYGTELFQQKEFVDTVKSRYLLFFNVFENSLSDSTKELLFSKGNILGEVYLVNCDSLRNKPIKN